jgi:hypothetical protein
MFRLALILLIFYAFNINKALELNFVSEVWCKISIFRSLTKKCLPLFALVLWNVAFLLNLKCIVVLDMSFET